MPISHHRRKPVFDRGRCREAWLAALLVSIGGAGWLASCGNNSEGDSPDVNQLPLTVQEFCSDLRSIKQLQAAANDGEGFPVIVVGSFEDFIQSEDFAPGWGTELGLIRIQEVPWDDSLVGEDVVLGSCLVSSESATKYYSAGEWAILVVGGLTAAADTSCASLAEGKTEEVISGSGSFVPWFSASTAPSSGEREYRYFRLVDGTMSAADSGELTMTWPEMIEIFANVDEEVPAPLADGSDDASPVAAWEQSCVDAVVKVLGDEVMTSSRD